jgi:energy-coupling factor transporter ATP-binding protein EcfA2
LRLIAAEIKGFGRIADAKINLDGKVIAIVGPNEAGKTTLLKALAHLDTSDELPLWQRSRAIDVPDATVVVSAKYVLDEHDRDAVADLNLELPPESITVGRQASGGAAIVGVSPRPSKNKGTLRAALEDLKRYEGDAEIATYMDADTVYADSGSDAARSYADELSTLVTRIAEVLEAEGAQPTVEELTEDAQSLLDVTVEVQETEDLRSALSAVIAWLGVEDPHAEVRTRLWKRTPDFVLFNETDRTLDSAYVLNDALLADIPAALKNLAGMAELDLQNLYNHHQAGDIGRRQTLLMRANAGLESIFASAWKQSRLSVRLDIDGSHLRVMVSEDGDSVTVFSERSAGLRMFVALIAFLKVHGTKRRPVLLIDEAENHLHIDAQADLVGMFMAQQQAAKVVYTTHSPACLPPDLGSGIRSVVPRNDNLLVSDVKNNFWGTAPGFTPLMMAMGAAAAAFTPARRVVLAEGATEMILLPSLIRAATGHAALDYQVAPGLSESPKSFYPALDLEGAKVAYLIDGDPGGKELKKALIRGGIPDSLIVTMDVPGLENVLEPSAYLAAVRALLLEANEGAVLEEMPELSAPKVSSWARQITTWAKAAGLSMPSKVAVAAWLVENDCVSIGEESSEILRGVHSNLSAVFS